MGGGSVTPRTLPALRSAVSADEAKILRGIARAQRHQDSAEAEEVEVYAGGGTEKQAAACRRRATQALWNRRKLTKRLEMLRAVGGDPAPREEIEG